MDSEGAPEFSGNGKGKGNGKAKGQRLTAPSSPSQGNAKRKRAGEGTTAKDRKKARQRMHVQGDIRSEVPSSSKSPSSTPSTIPQSDGTPFVRERPSTDFVPRTISVVEFAESRAFEITAMEKALENSTELAGAQRVFQSVPRYMRRRAASHNVKRLPKRLREKALAQIANDPGKPQNKSGKPPSRRQRRRGQITAEEFASRQEGKRWLETHVWHAKRMKMLELWGYKLAQHPNDKSFRATFRAAKHQCILHDASYHQVVQLTGSVEALRKFLAAVTDPTLPAVVSARYLSGMRQGSTYIYDYYQYPTKAIAPASFLWRPAVPNGDGTRTLWLWLHPAVHDHVCEIFREAVSQIAPPQAVSMNPLGNDLIRFQLTGPRSHALLRHVLVPCDSPSPTSDSLGVNEAAHKLWNDLGDLHSPASLPPGVVIGLIIWDPRLSFPPKIPARAASRTVSSSSSIASLTNSWPSNVAQSAIWEGVARSAYKEVKPKEGELNGRRSQALIPGTPLKPLPDDARLPILLIQRNCLTHDADVAAKKESREFVAGWDLIAPKGWAMDIWKSLVFAGARVGGLREEHTFHFESGMPCFPYDYPETAAYHSLAMNVRMEEEAVWERTPVGKRPNYRKLGVDSPFEAPFRKLVESTASANGKSCQIDRKQVEGIIADELRSTPQPGSHGTGDIGAAEDSYSWSAEIRGRDSVPVITSPRIIRFLRKAIVHNPVNQLTDVLTSEWRQLAGKRFEDQNTLINLTADTVATMLVRVRLNLLRRGVPGDRGIVYAATDAEYQFWTSVTGKADGDWAPDDPRNLLDQIPPSSSIVGYITTGQFSMAEGHGQALACCRLSSLHQLVQAGRSAERIHTNFVLVRGITGRVCVPATFELMS